MKNIVQSQDPIQKQIDEINKKLDLILEETYAQKQNRESMLDLVDDLSIVGKDVFQNTVSQLDKAGVEINGETIASVGIKALHNLENINNLLETLESINDFIKDVTPILHQAGLDGIHKVNAFYEKGYFDFFNELTKVVDNIVTHFSTDDVRELADKIVPILEVVKEITQPDMLNAVNNAVIVYKHLETSDIPEYSIWKMMREMNSPQMRKGMGFMMTFLKNLSEMQEKQKK